MATSEEIQTAPRQWNLGKRAAPEPPPPPAPAPEAKASLNPILPPAASMPITRVIERPETRGPGRPTAGMPPITFAQLIRLPLPHLIKHPIGMAAVGFCGAILVLVFFTLFRGQGTRERSVEKSDLAAGTTASELINPIPIGSMSEEESGVHLLQMGEMLEGVAMYLTDDPNEPAPPIENYQYVPRSSKAAPLPQRGTIEYYRSRAKQDQGLMAFVTLGREAVTHAREKKIGRALVQRAAFRLQAEGRALLDRSVPHERRSQYQGIDGAMRWLTDSPNPVPAAEMKRTLAIVLGQAEADKIQGLRTRHLNVS